MDPAVKIALIGLAVQAIGTVAQLVSLALQWPRKGHGRHRAGKRRR